MIRLPRIFGTAAYVCGYPFILLWLLGSKRVYAAIVVNDELLVTKNWLDLHLQWRLPGGGKQSGETDTQALTREINEELGIRVSGQQVTPFVQAAQNTKKNYSYSIYFIQFAEKPLLQPNKFEIIELCWIQLSDLYRHHLSPELRDCASMLAEQKSVVQ